MNKIIIVALVGLLLVGCSLFLLNISDDKINYDTGIDTGLSPEQTWDIINGEDIGKVLNLREVNS